MLLVGLFLFVLLIVVHEYGHFLVAKRNGVDVEEFGVGFPPKIFGKTMGKGIFKSYYTLNLLPLGGFVKLKGESDADKREGSFGAASFWAKTKITLAGVAMNFVAGALIFTVLAATKIPVLFDEQYTYQADTVETLSPVRVGVIEPGSPSDGLNIEIDDTIIEFAGIDITNTDELYDLTEQNAGQEVEVVYQRDDQTFNELVTLNQESGEDGYFGVLPYQITTRNSSWSAPITGVRLAWQFSYETLKGVGTTLGQLLSGDAAEAGENVSGPIGIFVILRNIDSIDVLLMFVGLLSITLAVMNVLPIPALDGGRLAVMALFKFLRRPLNERTEQAIHGTGMAVLLILVVLISVVDIKRFF